jgi:hypothetical protein
MDKPRGARTKDAALKTKFRLPAEMTPAPKALAALKAWQAKHDDPGPDEARRLLCSLFGFWRVCPHKRCRRALLCSSNPYACFHRFWPHVPEEEKVQYRAMIRARQEGVGALARFGEKRRDGPAADAAPAPVALTDCADAPSRA